MLPRNGGNRELTPDYRPSIGGHINHMRSVSITEFKAKCLGPVEEVRSGGESIEVRKPGKTVAIVSPPPYHAID